MISSDAALQSFFPVFVVSLVVKLFLIFTASVAHSQDYPAKAIRSVTATPGGAIDFTARVIKADRRRWAR